MTQTPPARRIVLFLIAAGVVLGALNNIVNPNRVEWFGSPRVLPKPEGWPTLSFSEGVVAGLGFAWNEVASHSLLVAGALLLLALGVAFFRSDVTARRRWTMSWWRLALGAMFIAASLPKLADPDGFAMMVAQYQMVPSFAVNAFSLWLPALELLTGLAVILSPWERAGASLLGLMMLMFIVALGQALARGLGIACGCFDIKGATDAAESWFALLRDVVLLVPIAWMYRRAEHRPLWRL